MRNLFDGLAVARKNGMNFGGIMTGDKNPVTELYVLHYLSLF